MRRTVSIAWDIAARQFLQRYRGNAMGLLWVVLNPLLMMLLYTVVFGLIFKGKYGDRPETDTIDYAMGIYLGIVVLHWITDTIGFGVNVVNSNSNLVKKVVFPLEALPLSIFFNATINFGFGLLVSFLAAAVLGYFSTTQFLILPLIFLGAMLSLGLAFFISAIGPFFRDLNQLVGFISLVLLNASAIFYSITDIPESLQPYTVLNPLMHLVQSIRSTFLWGELPTAGSVVILACWSIGMAVFGIVGYRFLKPVFADVV